MKSTIFYLLLVMITISILGCGGSQKRIKVVFDVPQENNDEGQQEEETASGVKIFGLTGMHPPSYKDKELGNGLFNHKFFDISNIIINDLSDELDRKIKIKIKSKSKNRDVLEVVNEAKKYFKRTKNFAVVNNKIVVPDIVLGIEEVQTVQFTIDFISPSFESSGTDTVLDVGYSINDVSNESNALWSTVILKDKRNNKVPLHIMKNAVTVSEFTNGKLSGNKPVTNIKYSKADDYCFKNFNAYVTPIYVFEYAMSQGSILPPRDGVTKEMISGYDEENDLDRSLHRSSDKVSAKNNNDDGDFSEIVIFDFTTQAYTFKSDNFISQSVTFRCAR